MAAKCHFQTSLTVLQSSLRLLAGKLAGELLFLSVEDLHRPAALGWDLVYYAAYWLVFTVLMYNTA